ncbi:MAG TPA: protein kinase [Gemmatimonadaceae bacterium]|nr:protein kinase [Gemmatimonadaceae bacterium]
MRRLADTHPSSQIGAVNGSISDTNRSADALWAAVARLVGAEYELAGELSASTDGRRTAYIATRRTPERELVLLVVERGAEPDAYELSLHEVLDESVPARDLYCRHCGNRLETWAAACPVCHQNTALATAIKRGQVSDLSLRSAVASALGADSAPLGQLPTASGSIAVFARAARTGEIVALTLERIGGSTGPTRAVPIVRLQRHNTPTSTPVAATPAPTPEAASTAPSAPKRPSSPHSGELGPLPERDRSLVTTSPSSGEPGVLSLMCPRCGSRFEAGARFCPVDGAELRAIPQDDLVGRVVGGKFRVEKLLGQGGMGRVYLAEHVRIGRRCALKVLAPNLVGDPSSIRRFDGEARNASRIVHPSVAVVYDFEETPDGLVYLVLEYVDGETLGAILGRSENQRLDVTRAIQIAREVADALQAAHELGIVHRDLKPDNIMLTQQDRVKVVDFGIAKAMETAGPGQHGVTRTGFVVGTPRYMSPEQLAGTNVDARSDIYALGCVLYEMVTGRAAYDAPITTERTMRSQPRFREDAPRALDAIITKAMSRATEGRFQTAREMRDALDALLARGRATSRRTLLTRIGIAVAAIAGVAAGAVAVVSRSHSQSPAPASPPPATQQATNEDQFRQAVAALRERRARERAQQPVPVAPTTPAASTEPAQSPPAQPKPKVPQPTALQPTVPQSTVKAPPPTPASPPPESAVASDYLGRPLQYLVHVKRVIREEWVQALEGAQPKGPEHAEFSLVMDQTGRVVQVKPISVSGQAAYDDPIESSLQRIVTFGPPPPRVGREVHVEFHGFGLTVKAGSLETPTGPVR